MNYVFINDVSGFCVFYWLFCVWVFYLDVFTAFFVNNAFARASAYLIAKKLVLFFRIETPSFFSIFY